MIHEGNLIDDLCLREMNVNRNNNRIIDSFSNSAIEIINDLFIT